MKILSILLAALILAVVPAVHAQSKGANCSTEILSARIVEFARVNQLVEKQDYLKVLAVRASGSTGICLAEIEYAYGGDMRQKGRQIVYISADGRYLFMGANDLSVSSRNNLLRVVRLEGFPTLGPRDAPVLIVEFGDFQCPPCRTSGTVVKESIKRQFGDQVTWVYKWLPAQNHSWAAEAAHCSACVLEQSESKFWELHDLLLTRQPEISDNTLRPLIMNFVVQARLDIKRFDRCLRTRGRSNELLEAATAEARSLQVTATPTIFVNGKKVRYPTSPEFLASMISREIQVNAIKEAKK